MSLFKRLFTKSDAAEPSPTSAEELKSAMAAVAEDDNRHTRESLYGVLLRSQLMLPTPDTRRPGSYVAGENEQVQLTTITDREGATVLPAFTDEAALLAWLPEGSGCIHLPATAVFQMLMQSTTERIWLNPGSAPNGVISRGEAQALANGQIPSLDAPHAAPVTLRRDTPMLIGAPAQPPSPQLLERVTSELSRRRNVRSAYLFAGAIGGTAPHLVLGLQLDAKLDDSSFGEFTREIADTIAPALPRGEVFDMLVLNDSLLLSLQQMMPPVYTRPDA